VTTFSWILAVYSSRVGVKVRVRIGIRFGVWLVVW